MARSGWAALAMTVLLVAGLGSEPALDAAADADRQLAPLLRSLTTFPAWSASALGFDSDMYTAIAVKIVVLLVLVVVLGRAAGHVGASFAAFLAGWGALMIAGAVAGVAYVLVADMAVLDGRLADSQGGAGAVVVDGLNSGVVFGLYTGWLVGVLVVLTARPGGLQAAGGWRASPPSRPLPVPAGDGLAGVGAAGTAAPAGVGVGAPAPDPLAGMDLVPGMPSVSSPGRAAGADADAWAGPAPQPVSRSGAADPWGPQPLSDPATRAAPAEAPWAPQLQSTADAAAGGRGTMGEPGPWATPPEPGASAGGQPFVPPGTWRRPPADTAGALPTAETPAVAPGSWPPSVPSEPEPPAAPQGPIVPSGTWPPSARSEAEAEPQGGTGQPFLPSGSWPPSSRGPQATNGTAPPSSYEQPEYSGLAPSRPTEPDPSTPDAPTGLTGPLATPGPTGWSGTPDAPGPPASTGPTAASGWSGTPDAPGAGADAEVTEAKRPLWPSQWPASSGGAYTDEPEVHTAGLVRRNAPGDDELAEVAENGANPDRTPPDETAGTGTDQPDNANTRFW